MVTPNGKYAYVPSQDGLYQYAIQPGSALTLSNTLDGAFSYPVSSRDSSLAFLLRRFDYAENGPGYSAMLDTVRVGEFGHMKAINYWITADGTLQSEAIPDGDWKQSGFATVLRPTYDNRFLIALNAVNHTAIYIYAIDAAQGTLSLAHKTAMPPSPVAMDFVEKP